MAITPTYTAPVEWVDGQLVTAADFNTYFSNVLLFLYKSVVARVYNNAALSIATATNTILTFNSERFDPSGMHSTSVNTSRITISEAGVYSLAAGVRFAANATGERLVNILLNGTTIIAQARTPANAVVSAATSIGVSTLYALVAGDYVEVQVYQSSGGNLNVEVSGSFSPEFSIARVGAA